MCMSFVCIFEVISQGFVMEFCFRKQWSVILVTYLLKIFLKAELFLNSFLVTSHSILHLEGLKINLASQFQKAPHGSCKSVTHPGIERCVHLFLLLHNNYPCVFALECRETNLLWCKIFYIPYAAKHRLMRLQRWHRVMQGNGSCGIVSTIWAKNSRGTESPFFVPAKYYNQLTCSILPLWEAPSPWLLQSFFWYV